MSKKELCHNCGEHTITDQSPFGWCRDCIGQEYWGSPEYCAGCGEESTADNPTFDSVAAPPVSGYEATIEPWHKSCLSAAAIAMVR